MDLPKKILVPVDLSTRSEIGVAYAAMWAETTGAELVMMANVSLPEREVLEEFAAREELTIEQAAEAAIHRIVVAHAPNATISTVLRFENFPADAILDVAASEEVDLIVVASHGRSGMTRWMLGSVAEKIARNAEVPILIVPARERA
jgi:nucleotide-binding universal stress UspA family protein